MNVIDSDQFRLKLGQITGVLFQKTIYVYIYFMSSCFSKLT